MKKGLAIGGLILVTVIVRVEHTEKYALSKTTGTDEEEITRLLLQLWQQEQVGKDHHRRVATP